MSKRFPTFFEDFDPEEKLEIYKNCYGVNSEEEYVKLIGEYKELYKKSPDEFYDKIEELSEKAMVDCDEEEDECLLNDVPLTDKILEDIKKLSNEAKYEKLVENYWENRYRRYADEDECSIDEFEECDLNDSKCLDRNSDRKKKISDKETSYKLENVINFLYHIDLENKLIENGKNLNGFLEFINKDLNENGKELIDKYATYDEYFKEKFGSLENAIDYYIENN